MIARLWYPAAVVITAMLSVAPAGATAVQAEPGGDAAPADKTDRKVDFRRDIQPILKKHCVDCHGLDEQQSGLRLDAGKLVLEGGDRGPAVVAGKRSESLLYQAITGKGDVPAMPMDADPLSPAEVALIGRWIDQGARIPPHEEILPAKIESDHWAFQPIDRPPVPEVRLTSWVRTPIDAFVLARLEQEGISPSPVADRATLIRRLSLDLIGLPPTPEEVEAFLKDERPDAYERLVDRLLASPHYGERWGRHWLDVARYADSNGYTIDGPRSIWLYRDWVIRAFNDDLPFDRMTIEQIAGDLLPNATTSQIIATGFHRNTLINQEGGTDKEQFRVEAVSDRVNTTGVAYLGLTIGCARCHEHKYDPIPQRDYYRLFAIFNNCDEPTIQVATPEQEARKRQLDARVAHAEKKLREHDERLLSGFDEWQRELAQLAEPAWQAVEIVSAQSDGGATLTRLEDGSVLAGGTIPDRDVYTITCELPAGRVTAVRLEVLTHPSLPRTGPGWAANGNFVLNEFETVLVDPAADTAGADQPNAEGRRLALQTALADWSQKDHPVAHAIDGNPKTGWAINVPKGKLNVSRRATFVLKEAIEGQAGRRLVIRLHQNHGSKYQIGRFRLFLTDAPAEAITLPDDLREIVATPVEKRSDDQIKALREKFLSRNAKHRQLAAEVEAVRKQRASFLATIPTTMVMRRRSTPRETHVHIRGDFLRKGAKVEPGVPAVLPPLHDDPEAPPRLDFARWLVDPSNPLTARVTVNRVWQRFFGRGLVETENDFGSQGTPPSHPELLDWLAHEFMRRGWSFKSLHRLIVTSAVYRQSSAQRDDLKQRDPRNRLLARQNRLRLEAEIIRDSALAASGLLSEKIGGPGVHPPQPEGIYVLTQQKKPWPVETGEDRFRRGLYIRFWRSSPYPFLVTFDAPDANTACTRRSRSNTPLQSLMLANDTAFFELAQGFAVRILDTAADSDEERLRSAFRTALARDPSSAELDVLARFLKRQREHFAADAQAAKQVAPARKPEGTDTAEAAAWVAVARVLLNLDEFVTRE